MSRLPLGSKDDNPARVRKIKTALNATKWLCGEGEYMHGTAAVTLHCLSRGTSIHTPAHSVPLATGTIKGVV